MAGQKLDLVVGRVVGRLGEPEAVDGGAVDGGDVGVVGLVAGVGGLAELLVANGWTTRTSKPAAAKASRTT